jgi:hypothetical protein
MTFPATAGKSANGQVFRLDDCPESEIVNDAACERQLAMNEIMLVAYAPARATK